MNDPSSLEILAFTDPVCTWCRGSEPIIRKLDLPTAWLLNPSVVVRI